MPHAAVAGTAPPVVWSGLEIIFPGSTDCSNAGCDDLLQWADGSLYAYKPWHGPIQVSAGDTGIGFDAGTGLFVTQGVSTATDTRQFVCQSKCEKVGCRYEPDLTEGQGVRFVPGGDNMRYVYIYSGTLFDQIDSLN